MSDYPIASRLSLERADLFLETSDDKPFAEFNEIDRQVCLSLRPDLDDFAGVANANQPGINRRVGKRSIIEEVDQGLHALAPLIFWNSGFQHHAAVPPGKGISVISSRGIAGSSSLRFIPTRFPLSRNSTP